jgi:hypothetical protein
MSAFCFKLESTTRSEIAGCHRDLLRAQYIARGFGRVPAISLQIPNAVKGTAAINNATDGAFPHQ